MWLDEWDLNLECLIGRRFFRTGVVVILAEDLHDLGGVEGGKYEPCPVLHPDISLTTESNDGKC